MLLERSKLIQTLFLYSICTKIAIRKEKKEKLFTSSY